MEEAVWNWIWDGSRINTLKLNPDKVEMLSVAGVSGLERRKVAVVLKLSEQKSWEVLALPD